MAKLLKQIRIDEKLIAEVQAIAVSDFDGNFTAALLSCAEAGVNMYKIPDHIRERMKAGMRRTEPGQRFYNDNTRIVIDALQI